MKSCPAGWKGKMSWTSLSWKGGSSDGGFGIEWPTGCGIGCQVVEFSIAA
jgi:hypothetical protein